MKVIFGIGIAAMLVGTLVTVDGRTWTDASTGKQIEAELEGASDGKVKLKRSDGRQFEVPLERLSAEDQAYVEAQMATRDAVVEVDGVEASDAIVASSGTDWPTWRGANRDNHSPDTGLKSSWPGDGPELLWTFEDAGKGYSSPVIVGGRYYVTGSRDGKAEVICLDAGTGEELWSAEIGEDPEEGYNTGWGAGTRGTPSVSDGMIYAMDANGRMVCLSVEDGKEIWSADLVKDFGGKVPGWGYSESPLVDGDQVVVTPGGKDGAIVALDKKTGEEIWRSEGLEDNAQYASLVPADVNGKRQYIQLFMNTLAGVDAGSGELLWSSEWPPGRTAVIPTPIYSDGQVFMTSGYGAGCKLVQIDGEEAEDVWENKEMKNHHGGVVLVDGHVYGFSDGGGLICLELESGEMAWNEKGRDVQKGAVHYADGMLYCVDENEGTVLLVEASPNGYSEKGKFKLPKQTELRDGTKGKIWSHPVVVGGKLYLRDNDLVFCYDVRG